MLQAPPPPSTPPQPHDEVHWMAFAIEALAVLAALAFAVIQSR